MANTTGFPQTLQMIDELAEIAEAARVANDGVPFVYESPLDPSELDTAVSTCFYVHDAEGAAHPGCIFGVWLHTYRGVALEQLKAQESVGVRAFIERFYVVDDLTVAIADLIQERQDQRVSWTDAVVEGREYFEDRAVRF